jgi:hypothetical protein
MLHYKTQCVLQKNLQKFQKNKHFMTKYGMILLSSSRNKKYKGANMYDEINRRKN